MSVHAGAQGHASESAVLAAASAGDHQAFRGLTDPYTRDYTMEVLVRNGIVTLRGEVGSLLAKRAAGDDAWDTPGMVDVNNELRVPRMARMPGTRG